MEQHQQPFRGHLKITSEKCDPPFPGVMLILITTYNFLFCFGHSMWDLSSLIRDQTWVSCDGSTSLYHLHFKAILCVSLSVVSSSVRPHRLAHQAPLSVGSPRQEYQRGFSFSTPGDFPRPRPASFLSPHWILHNCAIFK